MRNVIRKATNDTIKNGRLRYVVFLLLTEHSNDKFLSARDIYEMLEKTDYTCSLNTVREILRDDIAVFSDSARYILEVHDGKRGKNILTTLYRLKERHRE